MIKVIDTFEEILDLYDKGQFNIDKWRIYINNIYDNSSHIFEDEMKEYISSGKYTFKDDFLPILNNVYNNKNLYTVHSSFLKVTENIEDKVKEKFSLSINNHIVLYLGLCNGAGWVTNINGSDTILLGIEKILELDYFTVDSMYALIYHELGHIYHKQQGNLLQNLETNREYFVWQMFEEGIANYFEQKMVGDFNHYHHGDENWKKWCDENFVNILKDFNEDLSHMTRFDQRYFGDWTNYFGKSDVGYYLGTRFVHHLSKKYDFNTIIKFNIKEVLKLYEDFYKEIYKRS